MTDEQAEEERLAVIAKYDKGREEGAQIDDWEDPAFEIYHVTDRYGFIHDHFLPKLKADEIKRINIENERVDKWLKMTGKWSKFKNSEKLRSRIYKGIPDKMRPSVWRLLLDLDVIKQQQDGKYQEMYQLARKYSQDVRQIDLDVNRTYRDTRMFRERYGKEQKSLFNVLCAYSVYNSEVGYCQGMSQVAALLLMYMPEEDAFWALSQLMTNTKYGMHGFFIAGFPKFVRFQAHHDKVLKIMLPRMKKHFDKHEVDPGLYTLKWFFQCFLDRVPFELSLRLWDIFLLEGDRVLICGAYAILKMHQKQLLARKNMDDILGYIQSVIPTNFGIEIDKAIINYQQYSDDLRSRKLDTGGDPSDDELPKKPFGVIEIKPVSVPKPVTPTPTVVSSNSQAATNQESNEVNGELAEDEIVNGSNPAVVTRKLSPERNLVHSRSHTSIGNENAEVRNSDFKSPVELQERQNAVGDQPKKQNEPVIIKTENSYDKINLLNDEIRKSPAPLASSSSHSSTPSPSFQHSPLYLSSQSSSIPSQRQQDAYSKVNKRIPPPVSPRKSVAKKVQDNNESDDIGGIRIPNISNSETVRIHVPYSGSTSNSHINNNNSNLIFSTPVNYSSLQSTSTAHAVSVSSSSSSSPVNPRNGFDISKNDPNRIKIDISSHSTLIQ